MGKGTGLGLSISYDIVARHGGRIEVTSAPGEGRPSGVSLPLAGRLAESARTRSSKFAFSQRVRPGSFTRVVWVKPPMLAPPRLMNSA